METSVQKTVNILNALIQTNIDRLLGYNKAAFEVNELDLKTVFQSMSDESRKNVNELTTEISRLGGVAQSSGSLSGKLFRLWMDIKAFLTGKDRQFILNSCEYGEDTIQHSYRDAIASNDISTDTRQLIRNQQISLRLSHDLVRNYRERIHFGYARTF